ncbi:hypothetical protein F5Y00DRAFT_147790 [Daldinia vernicosa]|uniref:uncharacterized protein n=1 Tax=Daldinia vernicosa TaxID=114800 RepID=UPI002007239C|nr:uncharacterized protein F5Y00DRAFT_147790 [Daldinia vernicosa]KAI0846225.1 hypothetical protein F5Y00DRAFT_147790 [Daldinia vernicosa]
MASPHNLDMPRPSSLTYYNWPGTLPNSPSPEDPVYEAFYSVPSEILPDHTAMLCRSNPSNPHPSIFSISVYRRWYYISMGLTFLDAHWLCTHPPMEEHTPLSQFPPAEHAHKDCTLCMGMPDLRAATYLCGFHFCLLVGACRPGDIQVLAGLKVVDPDEGGMRCSGGPAELLSTLSKIRNLYVGSTPEFGYTREQYLATLGTFGAVGLGRKLNRISRGWTV